MRESELTERIIGAAIEVHRHLGPGLLESAYEECLCHELNLNGLRFQRQVSLPVSYKGLRLDCAYRLDLLVEDLVIVEIKALDEMAPIHQAQLLTYLKAAGKQIGLLMNFNVAMLKDGLKQVINDSGAKSPGLSPFLLRDLRASVVNAGPVVNTGPALKTGPQ
jgi:GxxExxY protein